MTIQYIKIADTEHGELGHNGRAWVLDHPYAQEDKPAFYEEFGVVTVAPAGPREPQVQFQATCSPYLKKQGSRGGVMRWKEINIPITEEQERAGRANFEAYIAVYPIGRAIVD